MLFIAWYRFFIRNFEVPGMRVGTIMEYRDATSSKNEFSIKATNST